MYARATSEKKKREKFDEADIRREIESFSEPQSTLQ